MLKQKSQIVVVFPIGIPGMGKSFFAQNTIQQVFSDLLISEENLVVIQNDKLRQQCMD